MAFYNLSTLLTTIKEDIGIADMPLPVSDTKLLDHIMRKSMVDFSIIYPRVETVYLGDNERSKKSLSTTGYNTLYEYTIPKFVYDGCIIIDVSHFDVARPNGYSDFFIPNANWSSPDMIIAAMADVRMAAGMASALAKAPTHKFVPPDTIQVYNGWAGGVYEVELLVSHDASLTTIEPGAIISFRQLVTLDVEAFLYGKLHRKESIETGVGTFQFQIDKWANAESEYNDKIKEWSDSANLDFDHIERF